IPRGLSAPRLPRRLSLLALLQAVHHLARTSQVRLQYVAMRRLLNGTSPTRSTCGFKRALQVAYRLCDSDMHTFTKFYMLPVLCQSFWVFMITYLHHHEPNTEVYSEGTWSYVKGQLQTVDRYYGFGIDFFLHHITDCHVTHHLFPKIPHYHLAKASAAVRDFLDESHPGTHKRMHSFHFVFELLRLGWILEYLEPKREGTLEFPVAKQIRRRMYR
ncbi:fatty acid desaturase, partial [Aphelenchoides avenae]